MASGPGRAPQRLGGAVRATGIADEDAPGVTPDDLEDGGGPGGCLARANLDGEPDEIGGQGAGMVTGRAPAAARESGRMPAGQRLGWGNGLSAGGGGVIGEVPSMGVQQHLVGSGGHVEVPFLAQGGEVPEGVSAEAGLEGGVARHLLRSAGSISTSPATKNTRWRGSVSPAGVGSLRSTGTRGTRVRAAFPPPSRPLARVACSAEQQSGVTRVRAKGSTSGQRSTVMLITTSHVSRVRAWTIRKTPTTHACKMRKTTT